jgi:integrase
MSKVITHRFVESVRPKAARAEYPDAGCPGLYLIVQPSGTKSWALRSWQNGKSAKHTLGRAGDGGLSLSAARAAAATHRHRLETRPAGVAAVAAVAGSGGGGRGDPIEAAVAAFLELHARRKTRPSTAWDYERTFNRIVLPAWRGRTIGDIRKRDVIDLVEDIAASGRGYLANRVHGTCRKFFNWLVARDELAISPAAGIERPHEEEVRDRVLTDSEVRALWRACAGGGPFDRALQVLLLTGARRNEVSRMTWSELDERRRVWILPSARARNARRHEIPLSPQAWVPIQAQPRFAGCPYVFSADGKKPITGWDKAKTRISAKASIPADTWRLHDLRRTCASGMQRLGIAVPVIEKALNHVSGVFRGIVGTYQQHDYADEIRAALERWADRVEEIAGGEQVKARDLRQSKKARQNVAGRGGEHLVPA